MESKKERYERTVEQNEETGPGHRIILNLKPGVGKVWVEFMMGAIPAEFPFAVASVAVEYDVGPYVPPDVLPVGEAVQLTMDGMDNAG